MGGVRPPLQRPQADVQCDTQPSTELHPPHKPSLVIASLATATPPLVPHNALATIDLHHTLTSRETLLSLSPSQASVLSVHHSESTSYRARMNEATAE